MEAVQHYFETIERGGNQSLVIDLPDGVDKAEVEVIIRPMHVGSEIQMQNNLPERYYIAQKMKGAISPDYNTNRYDVYDQSINQDLRKNP